MVRRVNDLLMPLVDWRVYALGVFVFGFVPGFFLRLIVLLYPPSDARRAELVAELYVIPRWRRPMFVAEQLETALFEGPGERLAHRRRERARDAVETLGSFLNSGFEIRFFTVTLLRRKPVVELVNYETGQGVWIKIPAGAVVHDCDGVIRVRGANEKLR